MYIIRGRKYNEKKSWNNCNHFDNIILIIAIGPMDLFTHGFFCEEVYFGRIAQGDRLESIPLENGDFEMTFSPPKKIW